MDEINFLHRWFQVWYYTVGLRRLLLRSTKTPEIPERIDILFQDVLAIKLTTKFDDICVREADEATRIRIEKDAGVSAEDSHRVFEIITSDSIGYVIAGVVVFARDDGEYNDPSQLIEF